MAGLLDVSPRSPGFVRAVHFAMALFFVGGFQVYLGMVRPALDVYEARAWVPVPITAGRAELFHFHGLFTAKVAYEYRVGEQRYEGKRYAFVHPTSFLSDDELLALQHRLPEIGFADPKNPSRAVIQRTLPKHAYRWRGLLVILAGCWFSVWLIAVGVGAKRTARVVAESPRFAAVALVAWATALALMRELKLVPLCILLGLAVWFQARSPTALRILAIASCLLGGMASCMLVNPFAIAELQTDALHDPGYLAEYFLGALSFLLVGVVLAYFANASADAYAAENSPN